MADTANPLKVGIHGAGGRMGQRLIQLIADDPALVLAAALDREGHPGLGKDAGTLAGIGASGVPLSADPVAAARSVAVMIDFSTPEALIALAPACAATGAALVVGTTGLGSKGSAVLDEAAGRIPVLAAANFSRAVNLLIRLAGEAAKALGRSADVEIVERHHRFKKDAPSGTALRLAEAVGGALGTGPEVYVHGRSGLTGERPTGQIGLHALRTGDNPGEHTVVFGLMGECLELSHRALNRDGFALGALDAAKFLAGRPPGRYTADDWLGGGR